MAEGYLSLTGAAGCNASTPDHASLDVLGDIEVVLRLQLPDYTTPGALYWLLDKGTATRAYTLLWPDTASPIFAWNDGAGKLQQADAALPGGLDGQTIWVKSTLDVDNGAGGHTVRFYYAPDQVAEPLTWTQQGSDRVGAGVTSIINSAGNLYIGSMFDGTGGMVGKVYRVIVRNGIGGTAVLDVDFTNVPGGGAAVVDRTGKTITTAGGATIVGPTTSTSAKEFREWSLFAADQTGALQGEIDVYSRLRIIARHNAVSSLELTLPTDSDGAQLLLSLEHPRLVVRWHHATFRSGPFTHVERVLDADRDDLVLVGVDDMIYLARRLAHPTPGNASPPYTSSYDTRSGQASQVLAQYVDVNAGPSAVPARRVPGMTVPVPAAMGGAVNLQARYENLLQFVVDNANALGLGVRVVDLTFQVFTPTNTGAVFSLDLGTMGEASSRYEAPTGNYVYVGGQGEGNSRKIREVFDAGSVVDWGRVETFVDRRDTSDDAILDGAGREALSRSITPPSVFYVPLDTETQHFPEQWNVGDLVTLRFGATTNVDVVREVVVELESGAPANVVARLGAADDLAMFRATLEQARRIRQLERV